MKGKKIKNSTKVELEIAANQNVKEKTYWLEKLSGTFGKSGFPTDHRISIDSSKYRYLGESISFALAGDAFSKLMEVSKGSDRLLHVIMIAAVVGLLNKYTGSTDIIVGTPVYKQESEGDFVNTVLPLRILFEKPITFKELLAQTRDTLVEAQQNQNYPINLLPQQLGMESSTDGFPLFDAAILIQNIHDKQYLLNTAHNITFSFLRTAGAIEGDVEYNSLLYEKATIERIGNHFIKLLHTTANNPDIRLSEIDILSPDEKRQLLVEFNDTGLEYPKDKLLHELFAEQAEKTPDNVAVIGLERRAEIVGAQGTVPFSMDHVSITYKELNEKSKQLAHLLRQKGVQPDSIVGIIMERSVEMIIGILGILKAGGAYLPINTDYPQERIKYMLNDSKAKVLLTSSATQVKVEVKIKEESIEIIDLFEQIFSSTSTLTSTCKVSSANLAYVMYTSGTSGRPKGVMVEHRSVVNVVTAFARAYVLGPGSNFLLMSEYTFDASIDQIFGALLQGAVLHVISRRLLIETELLRRYIETQRIHIIDFVPMLLKELLAGKPKLESLHTVISGADRLGHATKDSIISTGYRLYNHYGPTETTVEALSARCSLEENVHLGRPIANVQVYILNRESHLVPMGVAGELWIGGAGVSRGYLNRPELTAEKFINISEQASLFPTPHSTTYKTGDLARWLWDGNIEFLGRIDHQVKIRGHRIELGEIENQLLQHDEIKEAVVAANENETGDKYICAYIVPAATELKTGSDNSLSISRLLEYLAGKLPAYMIPSYFMQLEKIPLAANGKVDRKALPTPEIASDWGYVGPRDEIEETLVDIWSEVLAIEKDKTSITESFFQLGGHSLNALILSSKIHKKLNVKIPMARIFNTPTIEGLARYIKEAEEDKYVSIKPVEKKDYYALSSAQKRLYILQQMELGSTAYNMPQSLPLPSGVDAERLENTFKKLVDRHDSLRTSFNIVKDKAVQTIHEEVEFRIEYFLTTETEARLPTISDFLRPFDLSRAPLLRVGVIKTGDRDNILMVDMHHIICDGFSHDILTTDFMDLYENKELPPLRLQYKDFALWQNSEKQRKLLDQQESYWLKVFSDELPVLNLPIDYTRPLMQSFAGSSVNFLLTDRETQTLQDIAGEDETTLYMVILSVYTILLSKLSGQEDIIVGTPIAARRHADLENIIGMFANTLALRNYPAREKTFKEFLLEVKERTLEAFDNQEYQFEDLVDKVSVRRDTSRNPIFDVLLNLLNQPDAAGDNLEIREEHITGTSKFDLNLTASPMGETVLFAVEYCTKLFKAGTIERIIRYFKEILSCLSVRTNRSLKLADIEIISEKEKEEILHMSVGVREIFAADQTIHQWFQQQAARTPDHIAAEGSSLKPARSQVTYKQLNETSNQLAHLLKERGIRQNTVAGLMVERSLEMITGILGILKAGGAYLPIDPEYPEDRKKYMIEDSSVRLLLTNCQPERISQYIPDDIEKIDIREETNYTHRSKFNLKSINRDLDPVYIIYTSGSTGRPKGVMLEHRNLINLVRFQYQYTNIDFSKVLQFATISFDVSFQEIFSTLLAGGGLSLITKETLSDIPGLFKVVERNKIKTLFLPASFLKFVMNEEDFLRMIPANVDHIVTAGEQVIVNYGFKHCLKENRIYFHNHYGPSETHVVTTLTVKPGVDIKELPPIGRPISNTEIYILDKGYHPVPVGVPGELVIGGIQVGRGYLNRPELTAEKFLFVSYRSYRSYISKRIYKTGDLGRWLVDGNIEFLGRIDQQVKIRGFRVELGEIESRLLNYPGIKESVVLAKAAETNENYLCAYVVPDRELAVPELREYLARSLPGYMIPSFFVFLEKIPLTPSRKIDRKALGTLLPEPDQKITGGCTVPVSPLEEKLAEIWADVLNKQKHLISMDSNFFELGGHSLKATIMSARVQKELQLKLPLIEVFKTPNIRGLSQYLQKAAEVRYASIEPVEQKEYYALSSAQERLYILQQMEPMSTVYNMPEVIPLLEEPDIPDLEETVSKLINRHESLRTSFHMLEDEPVQIIHEGVDFETECYDSATGERLPTDFIRPFDLSQAPLLRVGVFQGGNTGDKYILLADMHHIISDGISREILVKDFMALYEGEVLLPLRIQYKDFSRWQNSEKEKEKLKQQETYWLKKLGSDIPVLNLPTDYPRPAVQSFEGDFIDFEIAVEDAGKLRKLALEQKVTLYMVLTAAYNILLSKLGSQEDIVMGTPVAGRRHGDLKKIMGMFVNTLVIRNYPVGEKTFTDFLKEVRECTLEAFENQEYPFEDLVEKVAVNRDAGRNPLFDVMFALQNIDETPAAVNMNKVNQPGEGQWKQYGHDEYIPAGRTAKFDLTLTAMEAGDHVAFTFNYCTRLFKPQTIERFIHYFEKIIGLIAQEPGMKISEIDIISGEEKEQLLFDFNNTETGYPGDRTIHELFAEQAEKTPNGISIVGSWQLAVGKEERIKKSIQLTYRQLNEKSNQLAKVLRGKGVLADDIIGIMMERSVEMIIGILGILKAGGAYLPIDPEYPQERIGYMLKDSNTSFLLTGLELLDDCKGTACCAPTVSPAACNLHLSLAYVLYTSGTTGRPRGVMVTHRNVVRLVKVKHRNFVEPGQDTRLLQTAPLEFDASTFEIWGPLLNGGILHVTSKQEILTPQTIKQMIRYYRINTMWMTSPLFNQMVDIDTGIFAGLETLLVGGDTLSPHHIDRIRELFPLLAIINGYGPTENTTFSTTFRIDGKYEKNIPIGKPIGNSTAFILDRNFNLLPIGAAGELVVGGDGTARGYLNRPELTAEKFLFVSYKSYRTYRTYSSKKIYKTGDLARWLEDGNIEFLGRMDYQVKIRGFRVELGEIENLLINHSDIREAVVTARADKSGDKYLCAYIVSDREFSVSELRDYLAKDLPDYMVPGYIVYLDRVPLTTTGKVDRGLLPLPVPEVGEEYTAPGNEVEEQLARIWSEVLGVEKDIIGIDHNFFRLGGHSLKATIMVSKIHQALKVRVPLAEVFKTPRLRELAAYIQQQLEHRSTAGDAQEPEISLEPVEEREFYPLSFNQKRLWLIHELDPASASYHMPGGVHLDHAPDETVIRQVLAALVERHESFRTGFRVVEGEPFQWVEHCQNVTIPLTVMDISRLKGKEKEQKQDEIFTRIASKPFYLAQPPLFRTVLLKTGNREGEMMFNMHHIICDGWSMELLQQEFFHLYRGYREGTAISLEPLPLQYKDFAWWQLQQVRNPEQREKSLRYWSQKLEGGISRQQLPADGTGSIEDKRGAGFQCLVDKKTRKELQRYSLQTQTTMFMVMFAAYNIWLSLLSGQESIACAVIHAGRDFVARHNIIGFFVQSMIFTSRVDGRESFKDLLLKTRNESMAAFQHQGYPLEQVLDDLKVRYPDIAAAFNMVNLHDQYHQQAAMPEPVPPQHHPGVLDVKYDIELYVNEYKDGIVLNWSYKAGMFQPATFGCIAGQYVKLLEEIAADPDKAIKGYTPFAWSPGEIEFPGSIERLPAMEAPGDFVEFAGEEIQQSIVSRFEAQVKKFPGNTAVKAGDRQWTYAQLNRAANRVAHAVLNACGMERKGVALLFSHDEWMIAGMLGALKAGKYYVPLDPAYPAVRLQYMIKDSNSKVLVTAGKDIDRARGLLTAAGTGITLVNVNEVAEINGDMEIPGIPIDPGDPAYILYTSGSTGTPKGVMQIHRNVLHFIQVYTNNLYIHANDRLSLLSTYAFDAAVMDIYGALLNGAAVLPFDMKHDNSLNRLISWMKEEKITIYHSIPTVYRYLTGMLANSAQDNQPEEFPHLRYVVMGGEAVSARDVEAYRRYFPQHCIFINGLGPTESTVTLQYFMDKSTLLTGEAVPVGFPVEETEVILLDENDEPVRVFGVGEIVFKSPYLAPGYVNQPENTAEAFPVPFYRTGDAGRRLPDGCIEYVGRKDYQVKIRGFRVEPGEIESHLLSLKGIKSAVVVGREKEGENYLCAYIAGDGQLAPPEIHRYLVSRLPDYMVPAHIIPLDQLPVTGTGKIDRSALPEPKLSAGKKYTGPRNRIEQKLVDLWSEVLGIENEGIGIDDDFFQLGGHSLKAIVMVSGIHQALKVKVPLVEVFKTPCIRELAEYIQQQLEHRSTPGDPLEPGIPLEPVEAREFYHLSFNQKRLWIIHQLDPASASYHMPGGIHLNHAPDETVIRQVLAALVQRHESFRTGFRVVEGETCQWIQTPRDITIPLTVMDISGLKEREKEQEQGKIFTRLASEPFDLTKPPLFRAVLLKTGAREGMIMFNMHHIICDGWSMELVKREFFHIYRGYREGNAVPLEPLLLQYKDFAWWQLQQVRNPEKREQSRFYWRQKLEAGLSRLELPTDGTGGKEDKRGAGYQCLVNQQIRQQLQSYSRQTQTTMFMVLFAAYQIWLSYLSGRKDIACAVIHAGRDFVAQHHIVGFFVQSMILANRVEGRESFKDFLLKTRDESIGAFQHQGYPLEQVLDDLKMKYPDIAAAFNMMNLLDVEHRQSAIPGSMMPQHQQGGPDVKYDIELYVSEYKNGIVLNWVYKEGMLQPATFVYMADQYIKLLEEIAADPDKAVKGYTPFAWDPGEIEFPGSIERLPAMEAPGDFVEFEREDIQQSIVSRFEEQVNRYPGNAAVKSGDRQWTYAQLNRAANRVAHAVRNACGMERKGVALLFSHDEWLVAGMLGALKAGKYYVPLDPVYPAARLQYMLKDSNSRTLVTAGKNIDQAHSLVTAAGAGITLVNVNEVVEIDGDMENPGIPIDPGDPAYILYTSGSTGTPKGVMQTHRNVLHFIRVYTNNLFIHANDRLSLLSSYAFDAAVMDIYGALLNGAAVLPFDMKQENSLNRLIPWMREEKITIYHSIPTVYRYLTDMLASSAQDNQPEEFPYLRYVVMGGEAVSAKDVEAYRRYFPQHCIFINGLGPTESTVTLQYFMDKSTPLTGEAVPVGFPVEETEVILLDENDEPVRVFGVGEIVFKSPYLAPGYVNQPENTAEAFPVPLYRTGDAGRRLPDGCIEYVGRKDFQLKIRGYRVEPAEIEHLLDRVSGIEKSVVTCSRSTGGENVLVAYIKPDKNGYAEPGEKKLARFLKKSLPDYMIPAVFVPVDGFPLTASGKIDRQALPEPDLSRLAAAAYTPPGDRLEKQLASIWEEVLGIEPIGIEDNFFERGGHSLKAIILVSRIRKAFQVDFPLRRIFNNPILAECVEFIREAGTTIYEEIESAEQKEYYPQSSSQQRLFFLEQFEDIGTSYNLPRVFKMEGKLDKQRFEKVFAALIRRHEILRTSFHLIDDKPVQTVHNEVEFEIEYYLAAENLQNQELPTADCQLPTISAFTRPFDLSAPPLLRAGLAEISTAGFLLLLDMHHIIGDGTSMGILTDEFIRLYDGEEMPLPAIHYKDFALWQKRLFDSGKIKEQEQYWLNRYSYPVGEEGEEKRQTDIPRLHLPTDYPRPALFHFQGDRLGVGPGRSESKAFRQLAAHSGATLYMNLMAAFNVLLSRYTGQQDIVVGIGIMGRPHADLQKIPGMFVNSLAIRNYPKPGMTYLEFLEEVKETTLLAMENQDVPFERLVEQLNPPRDPSRNPLFDVSLVVQNFETAKREMKDVDVAPYEYRHYTAKFDLTLLVYEYGEDIYLNLEYCTALFRRETIRRFMGHLLTVIAEVNRNPYCLLSEIEILTEEEKQQLVQDFNRTAAGYPRDKTLHQVFEEQVQRTPFRVAAVLEDRALTYRELDRRAGELAGYLYHQNLIRTGEPVGVMVGSSLLQAAATLGILKAGGAYVPLPLTLPDERIKKIITDARIRVVVAGVSFESRDRLQYLEKECHCLDAVIFQDTVISSPVPVSAPGPSLSPTGPAYLVYTSGSTGTPKGVVVEHRSVVNTLVCRREAYEMNGDVVSLQLFSFGFDGFVTSFFTPVISGARVVLLGESGAADIVKVKETVVSRCITHLLCVPALCQLLMENLSEKEAAVLQVVTVAGDRLLPDLVSGVAAKNKNIRLVNEYGVTEAAVMSTIYRQPSTDKQVKIGKPIWNTSVYILDSRERLQPVGVWGELCLAGEGLARGYLNNPQLTAEKFINSKLQITNKKENNQKFLRDPGAVFSKRGRRPQPHARHGHFPTLKTYSQIFALFASFSRVLVKRAPGRRRLYKTGDIARWLADGNIELLGRRDRQVKIRGYRIELGEIEALLLTHKAVKEAAVVDFASGTNPLHRFLCAYMVFEIGAAFNPGEFKEYLAQQLPEYMIPAFFVPLEKLPRTASGKVDRQALPGPETAPGKEQQPPDGPRSQLEEKLLDIWASVLAVKRENIGMDSNFFELGGHSLTATSLAARISHELDIMLPLTAVFEHPVVRQMARYINTGGKETYDAPRPLEGKEYCELTYAQESIWVNVQLETAPMAYNITAAYVLKHLHPQAFEQAFTTLVKRHESLRTVFIVVEGEPKQRVLDDKSPGFQVEKIDLRGDKYRWEQAGKLAVEISRRVFNLEKGPLVRVSLVRLETEEWLCIFAMHHIISDAGSLEVMSYELLTLYNAYNAGKNNPLPSLSIQYRDYAAWQNRRLKGETLSRHRDYWLTQFSGNVPVLQLKTDYPRPTLKTYSGSLVSGLLSRELGDKLNTLSRQQGATLFMTLVTAVKALLYRLSGQEDIVIGFPISTREHSSLENQIGYFLNVLALRTRFSAKKGFLHLLAAVKETALAAYKHQLYPFELLVKELGLERDMSRSPLFDVTVQLLNTGAETAGTDEMSDIKEPSAADAAGNISIEEDLSVRGFDTGMSISKFDLVFNFHQLPEGLHAAIKYNTDLFKKETAAIVFEKLQLLLEAIVSDPTQSLDALDIELALEKEMKHSENMPDFAF